MITLGISGERRKYLVKGHKTRNLIEAHSDGFLFYNSGRSTSVIKQLLPGIPIERMSGYDLDGDYKKLNPFALIPGSLSQSVNFIKYMTPLKKKDFEHIKRTLRGAGFYVVDKVSVKGENEDQVSYYTIK